MNIGELAKAVAGDTASTETEAKAAITSVLDQIAGAAAEGDEVSIPRFGKFAVKDRSERQGRNPANGAAITIAAAKKVAFTAANALKDRL